MEKNEVYDYLARIYLDKQPHTAGQKKRASKFKEYAFFLIIPAVILFLIYLFVRYPLKSYQPKAYSLSLATGNQLIKIDYNFQSESALKKEGYTIGLSGLDVSSYTHFRFQARRDKKGTDSPKLKVAFENKLKENSFCYIDGISDKWQEFSLGLDIFRGISRWRDLRYISFVVEEWNALDKDDCLYIDEIRFVRMDKTRAAQH